jgi:hypothetical protein
MGETAPPEGTLASGAIVGLAGISPFLAEAASGTAASRLKFGAGT